MKNKNLFPQLGLLLCCLLFSMANIQAQNAVLTTGGEATGAGGTVSYSVGQVAYTAQASTDGTVNQGVQQPYELFVTTSVEDALLTFEAIAYPNPAVHQVILRIPEAPGKNLKYVLTDLQGRQLTQNDISQPETEIPFTDLAVGTYYLTLSLDGQPIKTFNIIKK